MILKNLQPMYHDRMCFLPITTFEQLFDFEVKIEDALRDGKIKKDRPWRKSEDATNP